MRESQSSATSTPESTKSLTELFFEHHGKITDKWEQYLAIYEAELGPFSVGSRPVRLLEIGVQNGGSLQIWSKYLPPGSLVIGVDIDPACASLELGEGIRVLVADAGDRKALDRALGGAVFDVIVDDGSHRSVDIIQTFEACFDRLAPGGLFIVEDLHASYSASHGGGFCRAGAAVEWFKTLADAINADHFEDDAEARVGTSQVRRLQEMGCQLARLTFYDSATVVQKLPVAKHEAYRRLITGRTGAVVEPNEALVKLPTPHLRNLVLSPPAAESFTPAVLQALADIRERNAALEHSAAVAEQAEALIEGLMRARSEAEERAETLRAQLVEANSQLQTERAAKIALMERNAALEHSAAVAEQAEALIKGLMRARSEAEERAETLRAQLVGATIKLRNDDGVQTDLAHRKQEVSELQQELFVMRTSTSWKLTYPVRQILHRRSPRVRRTARRAAKAAWWIATGQASRLLHRARRQPARPPVTSYSEPGVSSDPDAVQHRFQNQEPFEQPVGTTYTEWCANYEPDAGQLALQRRLANGFTRQPSFSILVPLYRTPTDLALDLIKSVRSQSYESWELCLVLVDTGEDVAELRRVLNAEVGGTPRIRLQVLPENRGISGNTNVALAMATGDWVVLLDHDDLLSPEALYHVARAVNSNPEAALIYSDKDMVNRDATERFGPLIKPGWSPETMLNANYLTHLCAMPTQRLRDIGGWDPETDGAQDWDIFLRVIGRDGQVVHVPYVLYHWRLIETSVASRGLDAKPYAAAGQLRALEKYLPVAGWPGAAPRYDGMYIRIGWGGLWQPAVSVVVVGGPAKDLHEGQSVKEVLTVATSHNLGAAVDAAISRAKGEIIVLVDSGFEPVREDSFDELVRPLENEKIGMVAGRVLNAAGRVLDYGIFLDGDAAYPAFRDEDPEYFGPAGGVGWYRNASAAAGGALAFRRSSWAASDGFRAATSGRADIVFTIDVLCREHRRLMLNPFALFRAPNGPSTFELVGQWSVPPGTIEATVPTGDPFGNPNLIIATYSGAPVLFPQAPSADRPPSHDYAAEARHVAASYDITASDIAASEATEYRTPGPLRQVVWIIPDFNVPFYGGIHTVLRTAEHMRVHHGVAPSFAVLGASTSRAITGRIARAFPELASAANVACFTDVASPPDFGPVDGAVCTLWSTAYALLRMRKVRRKFYFVQDWEPAFYPGGTISAAVEATYRFGFHAICNTPSLADSYRAMGGVADHFLPAVDTSVFHTVGRRPRRTEDPFLLVCYARPNAPRNCFETIGETVSAIKRRYGSEIEIVTAGADWNPADYGLGGVVRNLGLLPYAETGMLYRAADAGLVAMATRHPSYLPFELMASGATVVTNRNPYTSWLLRDDENCLVREVMKSDMTQAVSRLVEEPGLRDRLAEQAYADLSTSYADWEGTCEQIYGVMRRIVEEDRGGEHRSSGTAAGGSRNE